MDVEIELRIPTPTVKLDEDKTQRIDNSLVRFRKVIQVPAFPRPGSQIAVSIGSDMAFECTIARADWHEENSASCWPASIRSSGLPAPVRGPVKVLSGSERSIRRSYDGHPYDYRQASIAKR